MAWLPVMALVVALILGTTVASHWTLILSCLAVGAVFTGLTVKMHRLRQSEQHVIRVQELTTLRQWTRSLRLSWRLLPSLVTVPTLHGQVVALMATCLDELKAYDTAIQAYTYLIDRIPSADPASVQLRSRRTIVQLVNGQLTDADEALRRLRNHVDTHPVIEATYRFASLVQQVRTNHWADAADHSWPDLVQQLRPLGIESGYGYALIALSCHKLSLNQPHYREHAQRWWSYATRLLPVRTLVNRFAELEQIAGLLPADQAVPPPCVSRA